MATAVGEWLADLGVTTLFIEPASPWENGTVECWAASCATSCSTASSSTRSKRRRSWSPSGAASTTACARTARSGNRPPAPETIAIPGFSLADYAPPSLTQEASLALT